MTLPGKKKIRSRRAACGPIVLVVVRDASGGTCANSRSIAPIRARSSDGLSAEPNSDRAGLRELKGLAAKSTRLHSSPSVRIPASNQRMEDGGWRMEEKC